MNLRYFVVEEQIMRTRSNIVVAYALAGLFTLFNVGLPIVLFVCPMMSDGQVCTCNTDKSAGLTISYEGSNCCSHTVVAERNTIPFLSASQYHSPTAEVILVLSTDFTPTSADAQPQLAAFTANTGPPVSTNPIYILSSSLLI
jgi:hypothetical protein